MSLEHSYATRKFVYDISYRQLNLNRPDSDTTLESDFSLPLPIIIIFAFVNIF